MSKAGRRHELIWGYGDRFRRYEGLSSDCVILGAKTEGKELLSVLAPATQPVINVDVQIAWTGCRS